MIQTYKFTSTHYRYRLLDNSDLNFYQELFGDPRVMKWIDIPWEQQKSEGAFSKVVSFNKSNDDSHKVWIVESLDTDNSIGVIGLTQVDQNTKNRDIGIMIHPEYQLQGLTSEIAESILSFGQKHIGLASISCKVHINHMICQNLAKKMGFELNRTKGNWSYWEKVFG